MSINFKSVPSGALRAGRAGQTESSRREGQILLSFLPSLFLLSPLPSPCLTMDVLFPLSSSFLLFFFFRSSFVSPLSSLVVPFFGSLSLSLFLSTYIHHIPGPYGDSGLAVNCVWCNPRGFYNRDFHPFFLPPGLSTGCTPTLFYPPSTLLRRSFLLLFRCYSSVLFLLCLPSSPSSSSSTRSPSIRSSSSTPVSLASSLSRRRLIVRLVLKSVSRRGVFRPLPYRRVASLSTHRDFPSICSVFCSTAKDESPGDELMNVD